MLDHIKKSDPETYAILASELNRQKEGLEMIPSENFVSIAVLEALGTVLTNKYSEGYPKKRYYGGNQNIDEVEILAIERAKKLFKVPHANVQPYSGSPANLAVYLAVCKPGDTIMGMNLPDGGHLTHGWKVSATAMFYNSIPYHVKPDGYIDLEEVRRLALLHKPKLIWAGATAYPREFPFEEFGKIADECGAFFAADIAHIAGLVIAGVHKSPVPYAHIVTTTTHKTLRGPRGGMIFATDRGIAKDPELASKIDKAIFPGLQGGPHDHKTAAIAVSLHEAAKPEFIEYGKQIVKNAKALGAELTKQGVKLVTGGTDNHLLLIDLTPYGKGKGIFLQESLDLANITMNKNTIAADPSSPFYPSGVRLGTPALTSRGMKEPEMTVIASMIVRMIEKIKGYELGETPDERKINIDRFRQEISKSDAVEQIRNEVLGLSRKFPLYPELEY